MSEAEPTACSSNAVLPTPASPLSTRTPLRPTRAPVEQPVEDGALVSPTAQRQLSRS